MLLLVCPPPFHLLASSHSLCMQRSGSTETWVGEFTACFPFEKCMCVSMYVPVYACAYIQYFLAVGVLRRGLT